VVRKNSVRLQNKVMVSLRNVVYMVEFRSENSEGIREFLAGTPYVIIADRSGSYDLTRVNSPT
jgi:uncharacterized membrane protein YcaP (DUF421 family)